MKIEIKRIVLYKFLLENEKYQSEFDEEFYLKEPKDYLASRLEVLSISDYSAELMMSILDYLVENKDELKFTPQEIKKISRVKNKIIKLDNSSDTTKFYNLREFSVVLSKYFSSIYTEIGKIPYIFFDIDDVNVPTILSRISYTPPSKYQEENIEMVFCYNSMGNILNKTISLRTRSVTSIYELLEKYPFFIDRDGTEIEKYIKDIEPLYDYVYNNKMALFNGNSKKDVKISVDKLIKSNKVIVDVDGYLDKNRNKEKLYDVYATPFIMNDLNINLFEDLKSQLEDHEDNENKGSLSKNEVKYKLPLPLSPFVGGYNIDLHRWCTIDFLNSDIYEYKGYSLLDKLVIPNDHKEVIEMLITYDNEDDDIVSNKNGGSFIIAKGASGLGKTLTMEVFSEVVKKPLYKVQCSQLGVKADDIERNLEKYLALSQRWDAILQIDEADVYINKREKDINQNAIVGIFLRYIENYDGIMFMTTNIDEIDSAILSRATIVLDYNYPKHDELMEIFNIIFDNYKVTISDKKELSERIANGEFKDFSGRDVKQLAKLSKMKIKKDNLEFITPQQLTILKKYTKF